LPQEIQTTKVRKSQGIYQEKLSYKRKKKKWEGRRYKNEYTQAGGSREKKP